MPIPEDIDQVKLAEAALAILSLSAFGGPFGTSVWSNNKSLMVALAVRAPAAQAQLN